MGVLLYLSSMNFPLKSSNIRVPMIWYTHVQLDILFPHLWLFNFCLYSFSQETNFLHVLENIFSLGITLGIKGYMLYDLKTHDMFISKDVIFYEDTFHFQSLNSTNINLDSLAHLVLSSVHSGLIHEILMFKNPIHQYYYQLHHH